MKKYDFKPLILIIPFIIIICALTVVDHPKDGPTVVSEENVKKTESTDKNTTKNQQKDNKDKKGKKIEEGTTEFVEVEPPIIPEKIVSETEDAKILHLAVGTYGSLKIYGGDYIYEEPDELSSQLNQLQYRAAIVLDKEQDEDDWYRVKLNSDGEIGYLKKDSAVKLDLPIGSSDKIRDEIVRNAVSYMGLKFVQYGDSLEEGIDCSNFIQRIYEKSGLTIPTTPNEIYAAGHEIALEDARPGDVIYYDKANDGYGHVGLYLGNGMIINSSGHSGRSYPKGGVRICCVVYPDRESYKVVNLLDSENDKNAKDKKNDTPESNDGIMKNNQKESDKNVKNAQDKDSGERGENE